MDILRKAVLRRGLAVFLAVLFFMSLHPVRVLAEEEKQSYLYDEKDFVKSPMAADPGRDIDHTVFQSAAMKKPEDLFATKDYLYVADTGNNRILKLDKDYRLIFEFKKYKFDGSEASFSSPSGIYVDKNENMLIADRDNKRLVRLAENGDTIAVYGAPVSKVLPVNLNYLPSKVSCDDAGRIFVAVSGFNMGLIELDKNGEFVQMLGASKVTYDLIDAFWRLFSTKEQQKRMASFVPAEYNNVSVDEDGFIFATTGTMSQTSEEGKKFVRKLNARGDDVLTRIDKLVCGDLEWSINASIKGASQIVDCVNLENGIYAILDAKRARVFVYDKFGTMLFHFGSLGQTEGTLSSPSSVAVFNGHFLVLDAVKNKIVSYNLTEYAELLLMACHYREVNDYQAEEAAWKKVYELNNNHPAIMREMGKILYRNRDMKEAMTLFKEAEAHDLYSKAFQFYRRDMINRYFNVFGVCVMIALIAGTAFHIWRKIQRKKNPKTEKPMGPLRYAAYVIFRPLDGFWDLKREKRGDIRVALGLIAAAGIVKVIESLFTGFIFNYVSLKYYNFIWDLLGIYVPVLLWVVCTWAVTALMNGEGSFRDIVTATGYAMTPIVIILPVVAVCSNVLLKEEGVLCYFFITVAYLFMAVLLVTGVMQTHNYSLGKTMGVIGISLFVIALVLFLLMLGAALFQQILTFGIDLKDELMNRW